MHLWTNFCRLTLLNMLFDYRVMKIYRDAADGRNYYDLLLAAVPRYMVEQVMQIMKAARMMIKSIDILPNSLLRLFLQLTIAM